METIKLIIWDMDETFWKGTLSDGEVQPIQENIDIVKRLTDRGIVNSVCSKNDFDKTKDKLVEMGIWDYFVFPSIDWTNKGIRVKNIISDMGLRPVNVLFLDDNINNLKEAQYECPALQVATPDKLAELLKDPAFEGKDDSDHSRLKQYKILEKKAEARQQSSSNEEFLYQSDIHVELIEDCSDKLQRIHEMIHRNNQLNFTKNRISREEVDALFTDSTVRKGVVHVTDKYGDHGIIGCYAIKDNVAKQFVFSCRILGMGVEQWVYAELGYPEITVVGEVANQLNKTDKPAWINQAGSVNSAVCTMGGGTDTPRLIVYGTCPLRPVWGYLQPKLPNAKFAEIDPAPPIGNLAVAFRESREYLDDLCKKVNVFDAVNTFDRDIVEGKADYILISIILEMINVWKYRNKTSNSYFYACGKLGDLTADKSILEDYEASPITFEDIKSDLCYLCEHLPANTTLIIQNAPEVIFPQGEDVDYNNRIKLNKIVGYIVKKYNNVKVIDIRKYAKTTADFFEEASHHYNRAIGYKLAIEVLDIMGANNDLSDNKKNNTIPSNAVSASGLALGQTGDKLDYVAYIRNGIFRVQLKLTNADKYNIKAEFWRNRYCETTVELDNDLTYDLAINKVGRWIAKFIITAKTNENEVYRFQHRDIIYDSINYINFTDPKEDNYDIFMSSVNQLQYDINSKDWQFKLLSRMISDLAASKVTVADYFIENNINELVIVTNSEIGSILLPYFYKSKVQIKYIISPDTIFEFQVEGGYESYKVYSIDELLHSKITINSQDTVLYAINGDYELFWTRIFRLIPSKKLYLAYVLNWLYTKAFFMPKCRQIDMPKIVFVRCPFLINYGSFPYSAVKPDERRAHTFLRDDVNALNMLEKEYDNFPAQYKNLSKEELKETLVRPQFYKDNYGVQRMRDRSGKYFNIKNGFRVTTDQPEKYDGTVYIFGNAIAYGCGNKDSDTIASKLQTIVGDKYRIENRGNMFGRYNGFSIGHIEALKLMENTKFNENDIIVFLSNNTCQIERLADFPIWEAVEKPVIKVDAFPLFEKQGRPDYFLLPEAYTAEGNQAIAELIADKLKEIGYLK